MRSNILFFIFVGQFTFNAVAGGSMSKLTNAPQAVQAFFSSIQEQAFTKFQKQLIEDITIDDWGKILVGAEALAFSKTHLVEAKAEFDIQEVQNSEDGLEVDGIWKSQNFTGPTRFIFKLDKNNKIEKLIISSPRWLDRLFIKIKSLF